MLWFISEFSSLAAGLSCSLDHLPGPPMPADGTLGLLCLAEKWLMNLSVAGTCAHSSEPSVQQEARVTHQMSSAYRKDISIIFTVFNSRPLCSWQASACGHGFHVLQIFHNLNILMTFYFFLLPKLVLTVSVLFCLSDVLVLKAPVAVLFIHDVNHFQAWNHNLFILNSFLL